MIRTSLPATPGTVEGWMPRTVVGCTSSSISDDNEAGMEGETT